MSRDGSQSLESKSLPKNPIDTTKKFSTADFLKSAEEARVKRRKRAQSKAHLSSDSKSTIASISASDETPSILVDSEDEAGPEGTFGNIPARSRLHKQPVIIHVPVDSESESSEDLDHEPHHFETNREKSLHRVNYPQSVSNGPRSQIRLLCDLSERNASKRDQSNIDTVSMSNLVGAADLLETYQFNFSVQLPIFLLFFHKRFVRKYRKIVFVTGDSVFSSAQMKDDYKKRYNISEAVAPLPNRFASHHTKMMVNVFENGDVEVIIMTCNLTYIDLCGLTQAVWKSGRLSTGSTTTTQGKRFRFDLLRYLARYGLSVTKKVISILEKINFSSVDVELIASAPGIHDAKPSSDQAEAYGYSKLRQVLERNDLLISDTSVKHNILAQVTSIAYPFTSQKGNPSSVFSHILCPLMFENWNGELSPGSKSFKNHQQTSNYKPHIIFPTRTNVTRSTVGVPSGTAIHFKYENSAIHKAQYEQNVRPYLCKWGTANLATGRDRVTPHVKYYACDNGDNWKSLKWVVVGSHNLSKQAWGYPKPKTNGTKMDVASYELSVLVSSKGTKLVPSYGRDTLVDSEDDQPVRFPFCLPPTPYEEGDKPWSLESSSG